MQISWGEILSILALLNNIRKDNLEQYAIKSVSLAFSGNTTENYDKGDNKKKIIINEFLPIKKLRFAVLETL